MRQCTDPTFLGTAIYTEVGFKVYKLSRLVRAVVRTDDSVEFYTLNTHYVAEFSDESTRQAFLEGCNYMGRLELC